MRIETTPDQLSNEGRKELSWLDEASGYFGNLFTISPALNRFLDSSVSNDPVLMIAAAHENLHNDMKREISDMKTTSNKMSDSTAKNLGAKRKLDEIAATVPQATTKKAKEKVTRKECIVCTDNVAINQFPEEAHASEEHDQRVCNGCWAQHLESEVENKTADSIACAQCGDILDHDDMKRLAPTAVYQRWLDKGRDRLTDNDNEGFKCPSASCQFRCLLFDGNIFTCPWCEVRHCVDCDVTMHDDESCQAYKDRKRTEKKARKRARENAASERKVSAMSKPCPNCGARLQKSGGCDHFTCSLCAHEFCWECFAPYRGQLGIDGTQGNRAHTLSCPYHPENLPEYASSDEDSDDDDDEDEGDE